MHFYDAHNHLQDKWLAPHLDKVCAMLPALDLRGAVVNGTCENDWPHVVVLAERHTWVRPSFGLHPWDSGNRSPDWLAKLTAHLDRNPHAAIGEIGLDRWMLERARPDDPRLAGLRRAPLDEQLAVFSAQLELAASRNLPATVHCLDAWGALAGVLRQRPLPARGFLLHAYSGSTDMVPGFVELGAYFSFNGYFLGEKKERHRETFKSIPIERLLVETDAPAMPVPLPWRTHKLPPSVDGQTMNHPGNIESAYHGLAALRGISLTELAAAVEENFLRLFGH